MLGSRAERTIADAWLLKGRTSAGSTAVKIIIGLIVCIFTFAVLAAGVREQWGAAALIFIVGVFVTASAHLSAR